MGCTDIPQLTPLKNIRQIGSSSQPLGKIKKIQTTNQYIIDTLPSSEQHESQFCHLSSRLLVQKIVQKPHQILLGLVPNGLGQNWDPKNGCHPPATLAVVGVGRWVKPRKMRDLQGRTMLIYQRVMLNID